MSSATGVTDRPIHLSTRTGLAVAAVYGGARVALRARRAWRNKKIIESVDTGSVWTTTSD
jgi:hypothetical protein